MVVWTRTLRITVIAVTIAAALFFYVRPDLENDALLKGQAVETKRIAALEAEKRALQDRVSAAQLSAKNSESRLAALQGEATAKAVALEQIQARAAELEANAAAAAAEADAVRKQLSSREDEVAKLKASAGSSNDAAASIAKANSDVAEAQKALAAKDAELNQLRATAAAAANVVASAAAAVKSAKDAADAALASKPGGGATLSPVTGRAASSLRQFPPAHAPNVKPLKRYDDDTTYLDCVGKDVYDHACAISNICYNTTAERAGERHPVFELFTGSAQPRHPDASKTGDEFKRVRGACIPMNDEEGNWQCHNDRSIFAGSLSDGPLVWRPYVFHGPIPEHRVQAWYDEPLIIFNRHWPSNIAHSIADDYFPIYQMQRDWLGWDANAEAEILRALEGHPSDPGKDAPKFDENAVPPLPPGLSITANLIFLDRAGYWDFSGRILPILYPNIRLFTRKKLEQDMRNPAKPLVCFRTAIAGAPGLSMHRNGAYVYHNARTWPDRVMNADPAAYIASHVAFVEYFLASLQLPSKAEAATMVASTGGTPVEFHGAVIGDGGGKGTILVINRKKKRELRNVDAAVHVVQEVAGGRRIVIADWSDLSTRDQAAAALTADIVIAVHGAGTINSIFLRPGTAWVDLLPPRATNFAPTFLATAQRFGIAWYTLPLSEQSCASDVDPHNQPFFDVDTEALKGVVALALGTEAR